MPPLVKILGAFPANAAKPTAKSTLALASKTVREAEATWLQLLFSSVSFTPRGLYGGKLANTKNGDGFTLTKYALAPGVFVSGKIDVRRHRPAVDVQGHRQGLRPGGRRPGR